MTTRVSGTPLSTNNSYLPCTLTLLALAIIALTATFFVSQKALMLGTAAAPIAASLTLVQNKTGSKTLLITLLILTLLAIGGAVASSVTQFPYHTLVRGSTIGFATTATLTFLVLHRTIHVELQSGDDVLLQELEKGGNVETKSDDEFESVENVDAKPQNDIKLTAIKQLQITSTLGSGTIIFYGDYLQKKYPTFVMWSDLLDLPHTSSKPESSFVAVPVILKGWIEDHIVTFFVDTTSATIEYYDSKGLTIENRNDPKLNAAFEMLRKKYPSYSLTENREHHQTNTYDCGVYILNYIERRLQNETVDSIYKNGLTTEQIITTVRPQMIHALLLF